MIRLRGNISKAFLLLAVVMLPVQQSLAATCCCRQKAGAVQSQSAGSQRTRRSQIQNGCCNAAFQDEESCCRTGGESEAGSKPCRCPVGCCGNFESVLADPATLQSSVIDELAGESIAPIAAETTGFAAAQPLAIRGFPSSLSGAQLCARLCRYLI